MGGLVVATLANSDTAHTVIGVGVALIGGLFPDWLSISFPFVRLPLEGHRGITHTLMFAVLTSLLINPSIAPFWFSGLLSHMLLDLPSDAGIPLFWPIVRSRVALGWFHNGGVQELITRGLLLACAVWIVLTWL